MPVISFANAKGGAGKTTAALLLATEVAERGKSVTIFDADPQKWISKWYELPNRSSRISVISEISPASITEQITDAAAATDYVIVDLEGTENLVVANALSVSDLVVVPIQGSSMDARGGAKILTLIGKLEKIVRHKIQHCVVLTRTNAAVTTRAMKAVQDFLAVQGIDVPVDADRGASRLSRPVRIRRRARRPEPQADHQSQQGQGKRGDVRGRSAGTGHRDPAKALVPHLQEGIIRPQERVSPHRHAANEPSHPNLKFVSFFSTL